MLAIEDLHWADRSTRDLLRFLAGEPARRAARDPRHLPRRRPAPRPSAAAAARRARARRLGRAPAPAPVHARGGRRADRRDPRRAAPRRPSSARSSSAPRATRSASSSSSRRPARAAARSCRRLLEDILHARFERLSAAAQRLLGVVAAGGPRVREALIAAVCGLRDDERDASLRDAVDHQILAVDGRRLRVPARAAARGRLRRAAARRAAPAARRLRRRARGAAGARRGRRVAARRAGAPLARGGRARRRRSPPRWRPPRRPSAATATPRRARTTPARSRCGRTSTVPRPRPARACVALLRRAAEAANLAGESTRAATLIRSALDEIDADLVPDVAGELHERLGRYLWAAGDSEAATVAYEEAVRLVPPQPPSRARARVLGRLGPGADAALALRRVARALRGGDRDRALGRRPPRGGPRAQHARRRPRLPRRPGHRRRAPAGRRARSPRRSATSTIWRAPTSTWPRSSPRRSTASRRRSRSRATASRCARRSGLDCDYGVSLRAIAAGALFELGRWDEAEARRRRRRRAQPDRVRGDRLPPGGREGRRRARAARRRRSPPRRRRRADDQHARPAVHRRRSPPARAELALWRRRPQEALAEALDGLGRADDCWFAAPLLWLGIRAAADVGDRRPADRLAARASEALTGGSPVARGLRARAARPRRRGWRAAGPGGVRRRRRRLGPRAPSRTPPPTAASARRRRCSSSATGARRRRRWPPRVAPRSRLGAAPLLAELELLAQRGRIERPAAEGAAEPAPAGLTARELEVLALVARGLTNRDVGQALFVTEKTASAHVSSILSKLSVRSRVEAAAAAHRLGLVET